MIKYHLKIAIRNIKRHKGFTILNVLGMVISMASAALIFLYVSHESSYDKHQSNADNLYRMVWHVGDGVTWVPSGGGWDKILEFVPEVEEVVNLDPEWGGQPFVEAGDQSFKEDRTKVYRTTANFTDVFDLDFLEGNPDEALSKPGSIVISKAMSQKYFGAQSAMGQTLRLDKKEQYIVTGIIKPMPDNSHFKAEILYNKGGTNNWVWPYAYLMLTPGSNMDMVNAKIDSIHKQRSPDRYAIGQRYELQRMLDIHLHSKYDYEIGANGDASSLRSLTGIGIVILLMGCVNFINMSTAGASRRIKEIGMRKIVGSTKIQLIGQLMMETQVISMLSTLLALMTVWLLLPLFNQLTGRVIALPVDSVMFVPTLLGVSVLIGLVAGIYPAFVLSKFKPVLMLKRTSTQNKSEHMVRRVLVVFQFIAAILLISSTMTISDQVRFLNNRTLGFDKESVIGISLEGKASSEELSTLKTRWESMAPIISAASTNSLPSRLDNIGFNDVFTEGEERTNLKMYQNAVGVDFVKTMGIKVIAGRDFSKSMSVDKNNGSVIINESAAKLLGWENPIGKMIAVGVFNGTARNRMQIIGIIEDFNDRSLREEVPPMILSGEATNPWFMTVRFRGNPSEAIDALKSHWEDVFANEPFDHFFVDEAFEAMYMEDRRLANVLGGFAIIAIAISALGLFGLSIFMAGRKSKEIGIRKVLGARVYQIMELLNRQFIILIVIALVVTIPLFYLLMIKWLNGFAYRIDLNWGNLISAFVIALLIAVCSTGYQTIRAALINPVDVLKNE